MRSVLFVLLLGAVGFAQEAAVPAPPAPPTATQTGMVTIPSGTEIPVTLSQAISTKNAKVGDPVYAMTAFPYVQNDRVVIPAGTYVQGRISEVKRPGRIKGRAQVLVHFTSIIYKNGYTVVMPGAVENVPGADKQTVKDSEGTIQQAGNKGADAKTVGTVAATGAGLGGIAGRSAKGVGVGGAAGAAAGLGYVLLTRGPDMFLPAGTNLQMVIQRDLQVKAARIE
jgi:hypothetical protein